MRALGSPGMTACALAAALLLAPAAACADESGSIVLDLDLDDTEADKRGRITIGFQFIHTDGNVDGNGNPTPGLRTDTRNLLLALDYRITGRWWLHVSLPYVVKRSLDDPGVHNVRFLAQPRDSNFIDDGDWHGAWQDWQLGVNYDGHWRGLHVRPHAILTWPSHDYVFFASAAPGRYLQTLRIGADIGKRFGSSNLHWSLGYSYEFVEEVLDRDLDRQHYRLSTRWDLSPSWSASAFVNARRSNGIRPSDLAGQVPFSELWYQHDRMLRQNYVLGGVGATWRMNDDWAVSLASAWPIESDSMHRIRQAWDLQLSRSF